MSKEKRRDYGSGSIYQRKDGRWIGAIMAGWTADGTRRRITVSAATEAQVKVKLRDKIRELEDGAAGAVNARTTVKQWAEQWLPIIERTLRPSSYASTASAVKVWIVPTIGHKRLDQLTPADVRTVMEAMRAKDRAETTRVRAHSDLMTLLKAARAEGHAVPTRVLEVPQPRKGKSDRTDIPVADAVKLLSFAADRADGSRWVAALLQGIRQGEALGLTWDAIDLERGVLVVEWQNKPLPYRHGCVVGVGAPACGKKRGADCPRRQFRIPDGYETRHLRHRHHLVEVKSQKGNRVIPLVPWMTNALKQWREVAPTNAHNLVWNVPVGDPCKVDDAAWYALQDAAGVHHPSGRHYGIHEARHTTATLLLEAGVDPAVVTAIMGHSSIVTSRGYQHVNSKPLMDAMEKVAERLALG